jgi:zinc transporter ZupT
MLFVSVHELLPMARRYRHPDFFLWGMLLGALVYASLAAVTGRLAAP